MKKPQNQMDRSEAYFLFYKEYNSPINDFYFFLLLLISGGGDSGAGRR